MIFCKTPMLFVLLMFFSFCNNTELKTQIKNISSKDADFIQVALQQNKQRDTSFNICIDAVYKILESSKRWKTLTRGLEKRIQKNGGTSYGTSLDASPQPKKDGALAISDIYEISMHESYPDHISYITKFTFDPQKNQLYEYDVATDSLRPLTFDRNLLQVVHKPCKK